MKGLLILLALLITLISCIPCQDDVEVPSDEVTSVAAVHNDSHQDPHTGDFCSPFCICTCCASVNMPPAIFSFFPVKNPPVADKNAYHYQVSFDQADAALIWQPPRLS